MCVGSRCCQSRGPGSPELCRACALERRIRGGRSALGEVRFSPLAPGGGSTDPPPPRERGSIDRTVYQLL